MTSSTTHLRQQFESLVQRAEAEVAADPKGYKLRLALLAALGYAVILCMLFALVAILGGLTVAAFTSTAFMVLLLKKKLILVLVVPIWVLFRSLFVRISAPDGFTLKRREFPNVWHQIDDLRKELGSLAIHKVVLTPHMNAAVSQTPRLGIFGPYKNTLVLGLELLLSLTPEQARAVLAHEFGHLSSSHGRFGAWIYRKRLTWARLQAAFDENQSFGTGLIRRFMSWYVPRLAGYSFALARQQEYEADKVAAELTSPRDMASALALCGTRDEINREVFWKPLLRRASKEPEAEPRTYSRLYKHLRTTPLDQTVAEAKLVAALRVKTGFADTHPALRDRLAAIGAAPVLESAERSAADVWLGENLGGVLDMFDADWFRNSAQGWTNRHQEAQAALARLTELSGKSADELTQIEAWQVASLTEEFMPDLDALLAFKAYKARYPDDADADFVIGRILLMEREDESGVPHLEKAAANPMLREPAYGIIAAFYRHADRPDLAETWLRRAEAAYDDNVEARSERNQVLPADTFAATRLGDEDLRRLAAAIKSSSVGGKIAQVWVAEKVLKHMPEHPVTVVLVKAKLFSRKKDAIPEALVRELEQSITLRDAWHFFVDTSETRALGRRIKAVAQPLLS